MCEIGTGQQVDQLLDCYMMMMMMTLNFMIYTTCLMFYCTVCLSVHSCNNPTTDESILMETDTGELH